METLTLVNAEEERKELPAVSVTVSVGKKEKKKGAEIALGLIVSGVGAALVYWMRPRKPNINIDHINLKGFNLRFRKEDALGISIPVAFVIDVDLGITISMSNPNFAPIEYKSSVLRIFYNQSLLGTTQVCSGSQGAMISDTMKLREKMDGVEVRKNVKELAEDVLRREMHLSALLSLECSAWLWKWEGKVHLHVHTHLLVDPLFLEIINQDNSVHLQF